MIPRLAALSLAFLALRLATAALLAQPGYTDSYYFTDVAARLARGDGLTADFLWSPLEAPREPYALTLPVASHLFWVPLPTTVAAFGIALFGEMLGTFRGAQLPFIALAALIPAATFVAARQLGARDRTALFGATVAGFGTVLAPFLVSVDAFAPAALIGTAFFASFLRAARGSVRHGALAGLLVGLLYLTRSEGALFGLALLALLASPRARAAGAAGACVALVIGGAWFARDVAVGLPLDLFARSALLVRYEDFFGYVPEYIGRPEFGSPPFGLADFLATRAAALVTNLVTFLFVFALVPVVPLVVGVRRLGARSDVRAWAALGVAVYLAQSLVWTLHSTRGSYLHSLAAFFPFGIAIAVTGAEQLLLARGREVTTAWAWGTLLLVALVSGGAVVQLDAGLADGVRSREAALDAIPPGPFMAIDAAAWRWIAGRPVVVTPSDGIAYAAC